MKAKAPRITTDPKGGVLFVLNSKLYGPGLFAKLLQEQNIPYGIVNLENGQNMPAPKKVKAVIVLGGHASANAELPQNEAATAIFRDLMARQIPCLGIGMGMHQLAKAAGGSVSIHAIREAGVVAPDRHPYSMALTAVGRSDELFEGYDRFFAPPKQGASPVLPIFQLHGETVQLAGASPAAKVLATGLFCTNQAIRIGERAWGIQGHFETTPELLKEWMHKDAYLSGRDRIGLLRDLNYYGTEYRKGAELVLGNFLRVAGIEPRPAEPTADTGAADMDSAE